MNTLELLLIIAGLLHFGILTAGALTPQVLNMKRRLAPLPQLLRQLIWVHGGYIVFIIIGFGSLSLLLPEELANGSTLGRAVCGFIALFWAVRLVLQFLYFRPQPFLTTGWLQAGYHGLTLVFAYFAVVYSLAAAGRGAY
jgi:hypothetical protein